MRKKKIWIFIAALAVVLVSFFFDNSKEFYGNDVDSIARAIKSINDYKNKEIEILQIDDFNNIRIVGFLSNNSPSYIEFNKNQKGNYVRRHIKSDNNDSFSMFLPLIGTSKIMFVTNYENEIAKMEVDINGITLEQHFTPHKATVTWIDLPPSYKNSYEYRNYKYFDKNGNLIKEN